MSPPATTSHDLLSKIECFVVLMLENRSFDHLLGFLKAENPRIAGLSGTESNFADPNFPKPPPVVVSPSTSFTMPFDPGHEFDDIQIQLYGPKHAPPEPVLMDGFVTSATTGAQAAKVPQDAGRVMECFQPAQVPVLSALAQEFCIFNHWHASLPGPTWPNRFFIHAATSGGLTDSPDTGQIVAGFSFPKGTIYKQLRDAGKEWKIYHEGLPQTAGLASLRLEYIDPFTNRFREMSSFEDDVKKGSLPEYVFIEPNYDTGHNYQQGNSMHPLNDIRKGEALIKEVYETLRASAYWNKVMLVITFDEHGGFYDHVPPPATIATGDDTRYSNPLHPFAFKELGVRVPALVISAFTQKGTVIGDQQASPATTFDHTSVLTTVEKRFGLSSLTNRDAHANGLEVALNSEVPRLSPDQAILELPSPVQDSLFQRAIAPLASLFKSTANEPLSGNQRSQLSLALACDLQVTPVAAHPALRARHDSISTQKEADAYIREVDDKICAQRAAAATAQPSTP